MNPTNRVSSAALLAEQLAAAEAERRREAQAEAHRQAIAAALKAAQAAAAKAAAKAAEKAAAAKAKGAGFTPAEDKPLELAPAGKTLSPEQDAAHKIAHEQVQKSLDVTPEKAQEFVATSLAPWVESASARLATGTAPAELQAELQTALGPPEHAYGAPAGDANAAGKPTATPVPFYSQSDPRWGSATLGNSRTIASHGCALTATAMALEKITGKTVTPLTLDKVHPYDGNNILWDSAAKSVDPRLSMSTQAMTAENMEASLARGAPVVVGVHHSGDSATDHWVTIVGVSKDANGAKVFHALDPAAGAGGPGGFDFRAQGNTLVAQSPGGRTYTTTGELRVVTGGSNGPPLTSGVSSTSSALKISEKGVSLDQLKQLMPNLPDGKAESYLPFLNKAMKEFEINTPERAAAFLAQLAHESGELKYFEEIASGAAYEGRSDLGNTQPGDGVRFKGRGPIQLTGRSNYKTAGAALGLDLVGNPEKAADVDVGFRTAGWFWKSRGLNELADKGDFQTITRRINGGTNGAASRNEYYQRALQVFGSGLAGGPIADASTSVPSSGSFTGSPTSASDGSTYSGGGPGGGFKQTAPAGSKPPETEPEETRMTGLNDIAGKVAEDYGLNLWDLQYFMELLLSIPGISATLADDPEFQTWMKKQKGQKSWKPGQPIPLELQGKFLAEKLGKAAKDAGGGKAALENAANAMSVDLQPARPAMSAEFRQAISA